MTPTPRSVPRRRPGRPLGDPSADAPGREQVELYTRTFLTVLRSSGEVRARVLERTHLGMRSSLHPLGDSSKPDAGALLYSLHRLPPVATELERVVMGQSPAELLRQVGEGRSEWKPTSAPGRRRRWWWDGRSRTLAVALASTSDLDDLVPTLVALQIEWNKAHRILRRAGDPPGTGQREWARQRLGVGTADWARLEALFGAGMEGFLGELQRRPLDLRLQLVGGTQVGYARATREWWGPVGEVLTREGLRQRPLMFVSSNAHSLVNLLSGVARRRSGEVLEWAAGSADPELRDLTSSPREDGAEVSKENLLYFAARLWFSAHPEARARRSEEERQEGIFHVEARSGTAVAAQVIVLDRLRWENLDPRLGVGPDHAPALARAPHVILNIQYPLGLGAYHILRQVLEASDRVSGVYVLGKAATLNADVGDVMIPDVVHDEHSANTYWVDNCFSFANVAPFVTARSVLDRQRAVSVRSTFLQNRAYLDFYYRNAYTVVEMESGPYLGAVYEAGDSGRYPDGEQVDLTRPPMDVGIIHYASDTPYTQARTLGARGLRFEGMEATYAGALAIAHRVLELAGVA